MPVALKASWKITWGVVLGHAEGFREIIYTSDDHELDQAEKWKPGDLSIFERKRLEAMGVSQAMQNGGLNNFCNTEFVWY